MKTHPLIFTFFVTFCFAGFSQSNCGQSLVMETLLTKNPELRKMYEANELKLDERGCDTKNQSGVNKSQSAPSYTIPMVFHILHTGGPENISDAQVKDQVAILNRDYQKKNADTINVVASFTNNIANVGIAFQLAGIDPQGNCTNGIIRHYTQNTNWDANDLNLFDYTWPRDKYLNIYVVKSINIAPAYSFLPTVPVPDSADVVVAQHNMIGSMGTSNLSTARVITHEVGHWLNLLHIWGGSNSPGVACGDDGVSDTPITKGFISCNTSNAAVCNPSIQENVQNYMDYAPCKIMFTNGQATRMLNCLSSNLNNRNNVFSTSNLLATGITSSVGNCIPLVEIAPVQSKTLCAGKTIVVNSYTSNASANGYTWAVNGNALISGVNNASVSVTPPSAGNYTLSCQVSGNGGTNSSSIILTVINGLTDHHLTYQESFEGGIFPTHWEFSDPIETSGSYWDLTSAAASHGTASAFVNGENAPGGTVEILETPSYDFLNNAGAIYSFKYAHARKNNTSNDLLKVQASKDCGGSWKDIVVLNSIQLSMGSGGTSSSLFIPSAEQWKSYVLTDHPLFFEFMDANNVRFRFYFQEDSTGYGNRLYLDEINFDSPVGINEYLKEFNIQISPNPAQEKITVQFQLPESKKIKLTLTDISGKYLAQKELENEDAGVKQIELLGLQNYPKGLYFLSLVVDNFTITKKLILS